ncbi:PH domain-containing protein [Weissella viridescens]|uniref:PH domain-containing protein n=1 Tax=Weissella viridescens TaxID=1629 RepID=UPI003AF24BFA
MMESKYIRTSPFYVVQFAVGDVISTLLLVYSVHFFLTNKLLKIGVYLFIIFQIYLILKQVFSWLFFKYQLVDGYIYIKRGFIKKSTLTIESEKINQVIENASFLYKIFNVTGLKITLETNSSDGSIYFMSLSNSEANRIKNLVNSESLNNNVENDIMNIVGSFSTYSKNIKRLYHPEIKNIFISSISSMQILAIYGYFETYQMYDKYLPFHVMNILETTHVKYGYKVMLGLSAVFLFTILGFIKHYLSYGNFNLFADREKLYTSTGLFSKRASSITKRDIYTLVRSQSLIMQLFRLSKFDVYTISPDQDSENISQKNPILPFINTRQGINIVNNIFDQLKYTQIPFRKNVKNILSILLVGNASSFGFIIWAVFFPFKIFPIILISLNIIYGLYEIESYICTNYEYSRTTLNVKKGFFIKKQYITSINDIEQIHISQNINEQIMRKYSILIYIRQQPIKKIRINMLTDEEIESFVQWGNQV